MKILITTNPGLEDVCSEEVSSFGIKVLKAQDGRVEGSWEGDLEELVWNLERSKSVHKAFAIFYEGPLEGMELGWVKEYLTPNQTFAVRAERIGEGLPSPELASKVGERVIETIKEVYGRPPKVNLDHPSLVIYAEHRFGTVRLGILLTGEESLHRRYYRVKEHMASLKPSIAYSLLRLGGAEGAQRIVDPMCGSGTIAIEAVLGFAPPEVYCFDINKKYVMDAITNAKVARVKEMIAFGVHDATKLHEVVRDVDLIVTNPPYGIRMGSPKKVLKLYEKFFKSAYISLKKEGKLVMITPLEKARELAEKAGLGLVHERDVYHGDLWAKVFIFQRP